MQVFANGEPVQVPDHAVLTDLFDAIGVGARWVVAEVNEEAVDRAAMTTWALHDGDRVELVRAVAGG